MSNETIHPLQAMVNGMNAHWQSERAQTGMTLGRFIAALESLDQSATVEGLGELISYRGHYCDLAFEPDPTPRTVAGLLAKCRAAMGAVFEGYKGGEFVMGATTPVWVSEYGRSSGLRLMGLTPTAPHTPITEHHDDNQTTPPAPPSSPPARAAPMGDAMTPETIRAALHEMTQMEFVGRMLDREYHAALAHALAALDAVARVRALHVPYSAAYGSAECEHCDHPYPCPTIRALDGKGRADG